MSTHNPKEHSFNGELLILKSKHLGEVIEVHIDKEKKCFRGIKSDGSIIEHYPKAFTDFKCDVMLYKIHYSLQYDTWVVGYTLIDTNEDKWKDGFATAREAWLYREALISAGIAKK